MECIKRGSKAVAIDVFMASSGTYCDEMTMRNFVIVRWTLTLFCFPVAKVHIVAWALISVQRYTEKQVKSLSSISEFED